MLCRSFVLRKEGEKAVIRYDRFFYVAENLHIFCVGFYVILKIKGGMCRILTRALYILHIGGRAHDFRGRGLLFP